MALKAPFRFAPTARWVYQPAWGKLASHDVPFKDGVSGEIHLEIEAMTPLLCGGPRRKASDAAAGDVYPVRIGHDGDYFIPSSTLQGMVRSILEIASFGRIGPFVDDKRFGIRDLTPEAAPFFGNRLNQVTAGSPMKIVPNIRTGWLQRVGGKLMLTPCDLARIDFTDLENLCHPHKQAVLRQQGNVGPRYGMLKNVGIMVNVDLAKGHPHQNGKLDITYRKAVPLAGGSGVSGKLVMTGLTRTAFDPHRSGHKHLEFVFFNDRTADAFPLAEGKFNEFLSIHAPNDGRDNNANWDFYNTKGYPGEASFSRGGRMPVFYLPDGNGGVDSFGLAFMFKLAHQLGTHDLLANSDRAHVAKRGEEQHSDIDLPGLIFGEAADIGDRKGEKGPRRDPSGLKRRAAFDMAVAAGSSDIIPDDLGKAVLLSPKPSYYPIYVRQNTGFTVDNKGTQKPVAVTYTSLTPKLFDRHKGSIPISHANPELSGPKIWPAVNCQLDTLPEVQGEIAGKLNIQSRLHALPTGTRFKTTLRVHNLRRLELGALLWALTYDDKNALNGGDNKFRHRIGMGKPYGLGEVMISVSKATLDANDILMPEVDLTPEALVNAFTAHMQDVYSEALQKRNGKAHRWRGSAQLTALLKAADPDKNDPNDMVYMDLGSRSVPGTYVAGKSDLVGLPGFEANPDFEFPRSIADNRDRPTGSGSGPAGSAPGGGNPSANLANLEPRLGDRVMMAAPFSTEGTVVGEPKDKNTPRWSILFDGKSKPGSYPRNFIEAVIKRAEAPQEPPTTP